MDGNLLLHLAAIAYCIAFFAIILSLVSKNYSHILQSVGVCTSFVGCSMLTISFLLLIYAYIISDMSLLNVAMHSNSVMPIHYRIAAVWGNHEGSMLLLVAYFAIFSAIFYKLNYKSKVVLRSVVVQFLCIILFVIFIIQTSNPFIKVFPLPQIGLGLNPVLQDFGLIIHPPILYLGHAACFVIYSIGITAYKSNLKVQEIKPWVLFGLSLLTLGIGLGSWWAYKEIGWGGFWFWDPVENISLLPWLALCALLHSCIANERKGQLYNMTLFLSVFCFITVLFGIFIVRSGLLKSVHSFAEDAERGVLLLYIFLLLSAIGLLSVGYGIKHKQSNSNTITNLITFNNWSFLGCVIIICLSIFYSLFYQFLYNTTINIGVNYFNVTFNTCIVFSATLCLITMSMLNRKYQFYIPQIITLLAIIGIFIYLPSFSKKTISYTDILALFGIICGFYTLAISTFIAIKNRKSNIYMLLSHAAFGLGVVAISISSLLSFDDQSFMQINDTKKFLDFQIKLLDIQHNQTTNYLTKTAIVEVSNTSKNYVLKPELRIFPIEKQMTAEPAISRGFLYDLHININQIKTDGYLLSFYYRPTINWLWISILMIALLVMIRAIQEFIVLRGRCQ